MELERAIEVFVRAFSVGKSRTHPYLAERRGNLWIMRDAPGRRRPRKTEVIAWGRPPAETISAIREAELAWHFLCDIRPSTEILGGEEVRSEYKQLGYRSLSTEWMFVHDLQNVPVIESEPPVRPVTSQAEADAIPQVARQRRNYMLGTRKFAIWDDTRDYGWVTSIPEGQDAWVQGLHVQEEFRRRRYGSALMSRLLRSDVENGVRASVLLASTAGAKLYPRLGYEQIAVLRMFCPRERDR